MAAGDQVEPRRENFVEEESEVGLSERISVENARSYAEYQGEGLAGSRQSGEGQRRSRDHYDRMLTNAIDFDQQLRNVAVQALQNAVVHEHDVNRQSMRHESLATDRQVNYDPRESAAESNVLPSVYLEAIRAAVAEAVVSALASKR